MSRSFYTSILSLAVVFPLLMACSQPPSWVNLRSQWRRFRKKKSQTFLSRFDFGCGFSKELGFRQRRIRLRRKNPGCVDLGGGAE